MAANRRVILDSTDESIGPAFQTVDESAVCIARATITGSCSSVRGGSKVRPERKRCVGYLDATGLIIASSCAVEELSQSSGGEVPRVAERGPGSIVDIFGIAPDIQVSLCCYQLLKSM